MAQKGRAWTLVRAPWSLVCGRSGALDRGREVVSDDVHSVTLTVYRFQIQCTGTYRMGTLNLTAMGHVLVHVRSRRG
eukprot:1357743-Prymnesium_polylepis.2